MNDGKDYIIPKHTINQPFPALTPLPPPPNTPFQARCVNMQEIEKTLIRFNRMKGDTLIDRFLSKCAHAIHQIAELVLDKFAGRSAEIYRTQEHLLEGSGSCLDTQLKAIIKNLEGKEGGFAKLRSELENCVCVPLLSRKLFPGKEKRWALEVQSKLQALRRGESLWVDAGTFKGRHSMVMRFTKNVDGSFDLQFANTGIGLQHTRFHGKRKDATGLELYQLVAQIKNIPNKKLIDSNFFYSYAKAAETGKLDSKLANELKIKLPKRKMKSNASVIENSEVIDLMYRVLSTLGTPQISNLDSDYQREQLTNSCSASSIIALMRSQLTPEEFFQFEVEQHLKSLLRHYAEVKSGYDRSATRKIMILDLIQTLKKELQPPYVAIEKIEKELLAELEMREVEGKIARSSRVALKKFVKNGQLPAFKVKLSTLLPGKVSSSLTAKLSLKKIGSVFSKHKVAFSIIEGNDGWQGKNVADKAALLGFAVANGDHEGANRYVDDILRTEDIMKGNYSEEDYLKIKEASKLLNNLVQEFKSFDGTRSGVAKMQFLVLLGIKMILVVANLKTDAKFEFNEEFLRQFENSSPEQINNFLSSRLGNTQIDEETNEILRGLIWNYREVSFKYKAIKSNTYSSRDNTWLRGINWLLGRKTEHALIKMSPETEKVFNKELHGEGTLQKTIHVSSSTFST
jgi:hypothetical protein